MFRIHGFVVQLPAHAIHHVAFHIAYKILPEPLEEVSQSGVSAVLATGANFKSLTSIFHTWPCR